MSEEKLVVKQLTLDLGEHDLVRFVIWDTDWMDIYEGDTYSEKPKWCYEQIPIETAIKLRDFLVYALKDVK
jgi:hypothetical protein